MAQEPTVKEIYHQYTHLLKQIAVELHRNTTIEFDKFQKASKIFRFHVRANHEVESLTAAKTMERISCKVSIFQKLTLSNKYLTKNRKYFKNFLKEKSDLPDILLPQIAICVYAASRMVTFNSQLPILLLYFEDFLGEDVIADFKKDDCDDVDEDLREDFKHFQSPREDEFLIYTGLMFWNLKFGQRREHKVKPMQKRVDRKHRHRKRLDDPLEFQVMKAEIWKDNKKG